ncbi:MAG TPA: hypothetical protein VEI51_07035, partial [Methanomicrobiales archaeon]|nr:hypothetical protein [Methanomicrobiales archaeon]
PILSLLEELSRDAPEGAGGMVHRALFLPEELRRARELEEPNRGGIDLRWRGVLDLPEQEILFETAMDQSQSADEEKQQDNQKPDSVKKLLKR